MLPEEMRDYYKYYIESLGACTKAEEIKKQGIIPSIKDLLEKGVDVNLKDNKGNTLMHYLVSNEAVQQLAQDERKTGDYAHVLDVPFMIATYQTRIDPFEKDANGFTPACLAAFCNNMKDHAMLSSVENSMMMRRLTCGLLALSQMMIAAEYLDSRGHRSWMSNEQNEEFRSAWRGLKRMTQTRDARAREM